MEVFAGESAIFSVVPGGTAPFTYQWYKGSDLIPDATNRALLLTNVQAAERGVYAVVARNTLGAVAQAATLTVLDRAPGILVEPTSQTVTFGQGDTTPKTVAIPLLDDLVFEDVGKFLQVDHHPCLRGRTAGNSDFEVVVVPVTCYRMLADYEEANDCAQETFVKIYRSLKHFRQESSFATWLYTIAVNTCKNRMQSAAYRHRKKMLSIDPPGDAEEGGRSREIVDPAPSPLAQLAMQERDALLQGAIERFVEQPLKTYRHLRALLA